jgi:hypothetical protein
MSQIVEKLAAGGHLSDEQVERIGETVHEFLKEAEANPELMRESLEKLGFGEEMMSNPIVGRLLKGLAIGGGSALGVAGVNMGINAIQNIKRDMEKARHYKAMIEHNPELAEQGVDSRLVQRHFNTLYKFNPEYASDPMVAGTYVVNSMEMARPNLDMINNMVRARKDYIQSTSDTPGHRAASKTVELAKALSNASEAFGRSGGM